MAFIRNCIILILTQVLISEVCAQHISYPARSSKLLKATAADAAILLGKAVSGSQFSTGEYAAIPPTGIIFIYDSSIVNNQECRVESDGVSFIKFRAAQDNGLIFGFYQYLSERGFRFYQPGELWEIVPTLSSPYVSLAKTYSNAFKYRSWMISGGHRKWIMDNDPGYTWDTYSGANGHEWSLYQRRNGMLGEYSFRGHRGDIMSGAYMSSLQANPCFVASYNGSRTAGTHSVPDIFNQQATNLWATAIEQKFVSYKNTIYGNTMLYADIFRNFNFQNGNIGIEVPDGPHWGNSSDNNGCNTEVYPSPSDQNFTLANRTANKISANNPGKRLQVYAYSTHANVPSSSIVLDTSLDIQVISTAFHSETSPNALMKRWYERYNNISEYHYLNIPQWGGETPMFHLSELKQIIGRVTQTNSQGVMWEASPAKFASLPYLFAANKELLDNTPIDSSLARFSNEMFGEASQEIYKLLHEWSDKKNITNGAFIADNKFKIPLYLRIVDRAAVLAANSTEQVKERIRELKAYLHYMVLYYDWLCDPRSIVNKADKAAALCIYAARTHKMKLVNSYFIIIDMVSKFPANSAFNATYNVTSGSAYLNGNLPLITDQEIDQLFQSDIQRASALGEYNLLDSDEVISRMQSSMLTAGDVLNVKLTYTNGMDYPNRTEFVIHAKNAGAFTVNYVPIFNMPGKGHLNFAVESVSDPLLIIKDITLTHGASASSFSVELPSAGTYKFSIVSKYKSAVDLKINTTGFLFYKNSPFLGSKTESYRDDLSSLPSYFYVPAGIDKVYFNINNTNTATPQQLLTAFLFKTGAGNFITPVRSSYDSSLYYLPVAADQAGTFWKVTKMEQYNLSFVNISNVLLHARKITPSGAFRAPDVNSDIQPMVTPNPSSGLFQVMINGNASIADELQVTNIQGAKVYSGKNTAVFDLSVHASGYYLYKLKRAGVYYSGRLLKL